MKIEIKKTILSVLVILFGFLCLDYAIGVVGNMLLYNIPNNNLETKYYVNDLTAEIVIAGSSRANHHYNSQMIEDSLGLSTYNVGLDGRGITYHSCILNAISRRDSPKLVILDLLYNELSGSLNDRVSILRPYYTWDDYIKNMILKVTEETEKYKCLFASYRYNSFLFTLLNSYLRNQNNTNKGYIPSPNNGNGQFLKVKNDERTYSIDNTTLNVLQELIDNLKKKNVKLVIVVSPELNFHKNESTLKQICEQNDVIFLDNSNIEEFLSKRNLFNDPIHLNSEGANKYTKYFIGQLKKMKILDN